MADALLLFTAEALKVKVVTIRSEGIVCSLCRKKIEAGTEALCFYNFNKKLGLGLLRFRHLECQFNKVKRNVPVSVYFERIITQVKNRKKNMAIERLRRKLKDDPNPISSF